MDHNIIVKKIKGKNCSKILQKYKILKLLMKFSIWFISFFMVAVAGFAIRILISFLCTKNLEFMNRGAELSNICIAISILSLTESSSIKGKIDRKIVIICSVLLGLSVIFRSLEILSELKVFNANFAEDTFHFKVFIAILVIMILSSIINFYILYKINKLK